MNLSSTVDILAVLPHYSDKSWHGQVEQLHRQKSYQSELCQQILRHFVRVDSRRLLGRTSIWLGRGL